MIRSPVIKSLVALVLLLSAPAFAQYSFGVQGLKVDEQLTAPPPCNGANATCLWTNGDTTTGALRGWPAWQHRDGSKGILVDAPTTLMPPSVSLSDAPQARTTLRWNGTNNRWEPYVLTQDDIGPSFTAGISPGSVVVEFGFTVANPSFTGTHSAVAMTSASINDITPNGPISVTTTTPVIMPYNGSGPLPSTSYSSPTTVNQTHTWTYTAVNANGTSKSATSTYTWEPRVYFGVAVPGTYNAAFITGLGTSTSCNVASSTQPLAPSFPRTIAFGAGGGTKSLYYAFPTSYGTPVSFKDTVTGFAVPFSKVASAVSITGPCAGVTAVTYDLWGSDNLLVNAVTVQVQ